MPMTCKSLRDSFIATKSGISSRHGGHQVAQKFTMTQFPRYAESLWVLPCVSVTLKSSAAHTAVVQNSSSASNAYRFRMMLLRLRALRAHCFLLQTNPSD